jgi:Na+/H+ antiporter NhaD/arsenite permease-like protein
VSSAAVGVDTLINAAGLYPFVGGLSLTNVWAMIADATNASSDLSTVAVVVISLFLGYILAATPERVWR